MGGEVVQIQPFQNSLSMTKAFKYSRGVDWDINLYTSVFIEKIGTMKANLGTRNQSITEAMVSTSKIISNVTLDVPHWANELGQKHSILSPLQILDS